MITLGSLNAGGVRAQLQAAHDALPPWGGVIQMPGGQEQADNQPIRITKSCTLKGEGIFSTVLQTTHPDCPLFEVQATVPVVMKDFGITAVAPRTGGATITVAGVKGASNQRSLFEGLRFEGDWVAIHFVDAAYWTINNCRFEEFRHIGLQIENTDLADEGDSFLGDGSILVTTSRDTIGVDYESSGGLKVQGVKMLGMRVGLNIAIKADTGVFTLTGCSLEGMSEALVRIEAEAGGSFQNFTAGTNELASYQDGAVGFDLHNVWGGILAGNVLQMARSAVGIRLKDCRGVHVGPNIAGAQSGIGIQILGQGGFNSVDGNMLHAGFHGTFENHDTTTLGDRPEILTTTGLRR